MTIKINHDIAKENLLEAYKIAKIGLEDDDSKYWKTVVDELGEVCPYRKSSTFVAALGTAILAKTVNINIDPYSLLDREGTNRSYSARSLADNVWAKNRAYLGIDLGANGANPLNNIPFIGRDSIRAIEEVRNKEGKALLFKRLDELETIKTIETAKAALRGFIASRIKQVFSTFTAGKDAGDYLVVQTLSEIIHKFVSTNSEEGRRAQGVAAGLLVASYGIENVEVGHINDPDRHFPLDITVFSNRDENKVQFSVEVKDKKVSGSDVMSSIEKVSSFKLENILYLAIGTNQKKRDFTIEAQRARDLGCRLILFFEWEEFCKMCVSTSRVSGPSVFGIVYKAIGDSLVNLGVSKSGLDQWASWSKDGH